MNFLTSLHYSNSSFKNKVEDYFYLGGQKAYLTGDKSKKGQEKAVLLSEKCPLLSKIAKIFSYCTIILPLSLLIARTVLRSKHRFKVIDAKKKLEKGMELSEEMTQKLSGFLKNFEQTGKWEHQDVEWLQKAHTLVFKFKSAPSLVFKMKPFGVQTKSMQGEPLTIEKRFENMVLAKRVCIAHRLDHLVVPNAKKIEIKGNKQSYTLIAERTLDFVSDESAQEEQYRVHACKMNTTAREISCFIAKTGFCDVSPRNIPVLNEAADYSGDRRIGLIDLEDMGDVQAGFFGGSNESRGLIRCLDEERIKIALHEAQKQGAALWHTEVEKIKKARLDEIKEGERLRAFHREKGIIRGDEQIIVDVNTLGLDLEVQKTFCTLHEDKRYTVTMRQVAESVIQEINKAIKKRPQEASIQGKRRVLLNINQGKLSFYNSLGIPRKGFFTQKAWEQNWVHRTIQALIKQGYLFKLEKENGHGYFIQA